MGKVTRSPRCPILKGGDRHSVILDGLEEGK